MADTKYKLRYLPLFYEDLEQKMVSVQVISTDLTANTELVLQIF